MMLLLLPCLLSLASAQQQQASGQQQQASATSCPPCRAVFGTSNSSAVYSSVGPSTSCSDGCLYRNENNGLNYCFSFGYMKVSTCSPAPVAYYVVAGGYSGTTALSSVLLFGSDMTKRSLPDLPEPISSGVGGVAGNRIVVCGGASLHCYSWNPVLNTSTWTLESVGLSTLFSSTATVYAGIWNTGGIAPSPTGRKKRDLENYPLYPEMFPEMLAKSRRVIRAANYPTNILSLNSGGSLILTASAASITGARYKHCSIPEGSTVVLTGGLPSEYLAVVERYNVQTGSAVTLPSLNVGRADHGCARFLNSPGDTLYTLIVAGGWNGSFTATAEVLYPGSTSWVLTTPLPQFRLFTRMVTLNNVAYIVGGGYTVGYDWVDSPSTLQFVNQTWGRVQGLSLVPGRRMHTVFPVPHSLLPF